MAYPPPIPPPPGERGLVPVTRQVYAAPGGDYALMKFVHAPGCERTTLHHDETVRAVVARMGYYNFSLVETAANTALLTLGCLLECRFDRGTTLGIFVRQHTEDYSYAPSLLLFACVVSR